MVNVERRALAHADRADAHFFLDHDWIAEYGEALPTYRPPFDYVRASANKAYAEEGRPEITVRY